MNKKMLLGLIALVACAGLVALWWSQSSNEPVVLEEELAAIRMDSPPAYESSVEVEKAAPAINPPNPDWRGSGLAARDEAEPIAPVLRPSVDDDAPPPITATAEITRGDGSRLALNSFDSEFEVLYVNANEPLQIHMTLTDADPNQFVRLEADNGGILNKSAGSVDVPIQQAGTIAFEYIVGGDGGKYTIYASQGRRQELMEFRVGNPPRLGEAGPPRRFQPDYLNN